MHYNLVVFRKSLQIEPKKRNDLISHVQFPSFVSTLLSIFSHYISHLELVACKNRTANEKRQKSDKNNTSKQTISGPFLSIRTTGCVRPLTWSVMLFVHVCVRYYQQHGSHFRSHRNASFRLRLLLRHREDEKIGMWLFCLCIFGCKISANIFSLSCQCHWTFHHFAFRSMKLHKICCIINVIVNRETNSSFSNASVIGYHNLCFEFYGEQC